MKCIDIKTLFFSFFIIVSLSSVALIQVRSSGDPSVFFPFHHRRITKDAGVVPLVQVCLSFAIDVKKALSKGKFFKFNRVSSIGSVALFCFFFKFCSFWANCLNFRQVFVMVWRSSLFYLAIVNEMRYFFCEDCWLACLIFGFAKCSGSVHLFVEASTYFILVNQK